MSNLSFEIEDVKLPNLDFSKIKDWLKKVLSNLEKEYSDIVFIFCSDIYLLEINKKYLNHDYYTDIITFDYTENNLVSGDIFISIDRVEENSKNFDISLEEEFLRIIVHGILHLSGFNDKSEMEKKEMTQMENNCLKLY